MFAMLKRSASPEGAGAAMLPRDVALLGFSFAGLVRAKTGARSSFATIIMPANNGARDGEEEDRPLRGTNSKKKRTVVRAGGADHTELEPVAIE